MSQSDPVLTYLDEQIVWYDRAAARAQVAFRAGKMVALMAAAAVPFCALLGAPAALTAGMGALIAVLEGMQQLFRFHETWLNSRSACEALRRERFLYTAGAGPYAEPARAGRPAATVLAERVAALTIEEHAKWIVVTERTMAAGAARAADTFPAGGAAQGRIGWRSRCAPLAQPHPHRATHGRGWTNASLHGLCRRAAGGIAKEVGYGRPPGTG
jgi:hypothetical protein